MDATLCQDAPLTVGVVGLGLIGGSFARAYHEAGARVLAFDIDEDILDAARVDVVQAPLDDAGIPSCDLIILAAYPEASLGWLRAHADALAAASTPPPSRDPWSSTPRASSAASATRPSPSPQSAAYCSWGRTLMAGTEHSGFAHARADLFRGAPMVLVPPALPDIERLMLPRPPARPPRPAGFGSFSVTTPEEHDRVIAFTSQLAHVVSNAYVKSPTARMHHGFSAGSYRDLTRVAHLNPGMWAELMCLNADNMVREIEGIIDALSAYRDALAAGDRDALRALLAEGDRIKRSLDDADDR